MSKQKLKLVTSGSEAAVLNSHLAALKEFEMKTELDSREADFFLDKIEELLGEYKHRVIRDPHNSTLAYTSLSTIEKLISALIVEIEMIGRNLISRLAIWQIVSNFFADIIEHDIAKLDYRNHPTIEAESIAHDLMYQLEEMWRIKLIELSTKRWGYDRIRTLNIKNKSLGSYTLYDPSKPSNEAVINDKINQALIRFLPQYADIMDQMDKFVNHYGDLE